MSRLIIGVGGTGAKVVESFIHLCGAGLGPQEDVTVAWIDQDVANGNTEQSRTALREYMLAHRVLRRAAGHRVPDSMTCDLLRTGLTPLGGDIESDNCLWVPHRDSDATLAKIIGYNLMEDSEKDLARVLFDSGEVELGMGLNEGYRGRPHIGSAAFLVSLRGSGSWDSLRRFIEEGNEQDARVFLCGSVFGGTGAAIFPTLARRLRDGKPRLRISGALMLPYFTFRSPDDDETANVVLSNQMLLQSRSALEYYDSLLMSSTRVFDELYVLGWREPFVLPYHAAGARGQRNPPLVPELFGALAAAKFFRTPAATAPSGTEYHCIARSATEELAWRDVPEVVEREHRVGDAYASWLRFCALWHFSYGKAVRLGRRAAQQGAMAPTRTRRRVFRRRRHKNGTRRRRICRNLPAVWGRDVSILRHEIERRTHIRPLGARAHRGGRAGQTHSAAGSRLWNAGQRYQYPGPFGYRRRPSSGPRRSIGKSPRSGRKNRAWERWSHRFTSVL